MKTKTEEIDALIEEALTEEEAAYYRQLDEQSITEMMLGVYQGRWGWLTIIMSIVMVITFALSVYCAIQFFAVESVQDMLKWGSGAWLGILASSMLKLFYWLQMDKNSLIREIKRLEYQVSLLAKKMP
jgi:hypothetical protein